MSGVVLLDVFPRRHLEEWGRVGVIDVGYVPDSFPAVTRLDIFIDKGTYDAVSMLALWRVP